ncbi:hypothetical protein K491DRAFT_683286 [Lophiostoma macrostomum CBS 122681]|uniref:Extracellular membrane protein CFEM domain-containing protein n=1 Tax=Lophiostoma macrostomum CBS 122681 TaxID=1314788 RepID=A0A6A6SQI1_9PLEO|nr:hypothetical protein K491DRAFT_683286 [Lophiostoma macrostomum CBS 122681]
MRAAFVLAGLVALVAAVPQPQANPTVPVPASTSLNVIVTGIPSLAPSGIFGNATTSKTHHPHSEQIPSLMKPCDCPDVKTVAYPCWATDSLQKCNFEEIHSWGCWTSAAFGCPSPTRECSALYTPAPPITTGKHPCDLGPGGGFRPEPTTEAVYRL